MVMTIFFDGFALIIYGLLALLFLYVLVASKIITWKEKIAKRRADSKAKKED